VRGDGSQRSFAVKTSATDCVTSVQITRKNNRGVSAFASAQPPRLVVFFLGWRKNDQSPKPIANVNLGAYNRHRHETYSFSVGQNGRGAERRFSGVRCPYLNAGTLLVQGS
jgi:hypothetical protein